MPGQGHQPAIASPAAIPAPTRMRVSARPSRETCSSPIARHLVSGGDGAAESAWRLALATVAKGKPAKARFETRKEASGSGFRGLGSARSRSLLLVPGSELLVLARERDTPACSERRQ